VEAFGGVGGGVEIILEKVAYQIMQGYSQYEKDHRKRRVVGVETVRFR